METYTYNTDGRRHIISDNLPLLICEHATECPEKGCKHAVPHNDIVPLLKHLVYQERCIWTPCGSLSIRKTGLCKPIDDNHKIIEFKGD